MPTETANVSEDSAPKDNVPPFGKKDEGASNVPEFESDGPHGDSEDAGFPQSGPQPTGQYPLSTKPRHMPPGAGSGDKQVEKEEERQQEKQEKMMLQLMMGIQPGGQPGQPGQPGESGGGEDAGSDLVDPATDAVNQMTAYIHRYNDVPLKTAHKLAREVVAEYTVEAIYDWVSNRNYRGNPAPHQVGSGAWDEAKANIQQKHDAMGDELAELQNPTDRSPYDNGSQMHDYLSRGEKQQRLRHDTNDLRTRRWKAYQDFQMNRGAPNAHPDFATHWQNEQHNYPMNPWRRRGGLFSP